MLDRYKARFGELEERGHKAFIPFTVLGWPNRDECVKHIGAMVRAGSSALELGFPFSDPVADGPVIQRASHEVLERGFTVEEGFEIIQRARDFGPSTPIGLLVYYNMVLAKGIDEFFRVCRFSGVDAVLIADLPIENSGEVAASAAEHGVHLVFLVSPVTTAQRLQLICSKAGGFIYLVSRLGVTGTGDRDEDKDRPLANIISQVKQLTSIPICAGFGVSTPEHAKKLLSLGADGVITGSRVLEIIRSAGAENAERELLAYCTEMVEACTAAGAACS